MSIALSIRDCDLESPLRRLSWFLRETVGLNQWIFRLWFLSGAMLVPAYLGTGMLYMMAPRRVSNAFLGYLLVVTVAAVVLVLTAHIRTPDACAAGLTALECLVPSLTLTEMGFFPPWIRVLAAILNLYGGLAVLAGAVWAVGMLAREGASEASSAGPEATEAGRRPVLAILAESQRNVMLDSLVKSLFRSNQNKRTLAWVQYTVSVQYTTPT